MIIIRSVGVDRYGIAGASRRNQIVTYTGMHGPWRVIAFETNHFGVRSFLINGPVDEHAACFAGERCRPQREREKTDKDAFGCHRTAHDLQ